MKHFLSLIGFVAILGCGTNSPKPGTIHMSSAPIIKSEKDPDTKFNAYKKFSFNSLAGQDKNFEFNPIQEKQLFFIIRNSLEQLGYDYVESTLDSDFCVGIFFSNEYKSAYIPPSTIVMPQFIPGQTQTSFINFSGGGESYSGTATTTTSGHYTMTNITRPGQFIGSYYPYFGVLAVDTKTTKLAWTGSAIVSTEEPDLRKSADVLLNTLMLSKFPKSESWLKKDENKTGYFGVSFYILTLDGNDFYPFVTGIWVNSPADKAGLKIYDVIIGIEGESTLNMPNSQISKFFNKKCSEKLELSIRRDDKILPVTLDAVSAEIVRCQWQKKRTFGKRGKIETVAISDLQAELDIKNGEDFYNSIR